MNNVFTQSGLPAPELLLLISKEAVYHVRVAKSTNFLALTSESASSSLRVKNLITKSKILVGGRLRPVKFGNLKITNQTQKYQLTILFGADCLFTRNQLLLINAKLANNRV